MTNLDDNAITSAFLLDNKIRVMEVAEVTYADDVTTTAGTGTIRFAYEKSSDTDATTFHVGVRPATADAGVFTTGQFVQCQRDNAVGPQAVDPGTLGSEVVTSHEMTIDGVTYVYVTLTIDGVETSSGAYQLVIDTEGAGEVNLFGLQIELN